MTIARASNARTPPTADGLGLAVPVIRALDENHCIATWDNVLIQVWHGEATVHGVASLIEAAQDLTARKASTPLGLAFVVERTSPVPTDQVRVLMSAFFRDLSPNFTHRFVVAEGGSFRRALVRSIGVDLSNLGPEPIPFRYTESIQQTAELIAPVLSPT